MELDFIFITYHTNTHIFVVLSIFMHLFIVLYTIRRRHTERKECYTLPYLILHTLHNLADFPYKDAEYGNIGNVREILRADSTKQIFA